jgi:hypothetical protein
MPCRSRTSECQRAALASSKQRVSSLAKFPGSRTKNGRNQPVGSWPIDTTVNGRFPFYRYMMLSVFELVHSSNPPDPSSSLHLPDSMNHMSGLTGVKILQGFTEEEIVSASFINLCLINVWIL